MSVTGCVKQGSDANGYYLMSQDGKMYELWGKNFGEHMGHTVTVTGMQAQLDASAWSRRKKPARNPKPAPPRYVDLKVSSLKMVSESCQ